MKKAIQSQRNKLISFFYSSFLLTIPLYFILDANNQFWGLIPFISSLTIFLDLVATSVFLFFLLRKYCGPVKSTFFISWVLINYLFFKTIKDFITSTSVFHILIHYKYYIPVVGLMSFFFFWVVYNLKENQLQKLRTFINLLFFLFVLTEGLKAGFNWYKPGLPPLNTEKLSFSTIFRKERPDIYLFVLDEYAGSLSLKKNHDFDNSAFENELKKRSFFVAKNPNSNYNSTPFSILSMLDMGYIKNLDEPRLKSVAGYGESVKAIQNNQLTKFLIQNGYQVINNSFFRIDTASYQHFLFLPIEKRIAMDKTFGSILLNDLLLNISSNRIQFLLNTYNSKIDNYNQSCIQNLNTSIKDGKKPFFIYTHLLIPHSPYLRDSSENLRNLADAQKELNSNNGGIAYINYLKYCNIVIIKSIDNILTKDPDSIIILVSDHGNRLSRKENNYLTDFNNIITVYYGNKEYSDFSDTICLVNLFRKVLNKNFDQHLPILENKIFNIRDSTPHFLNIAKEL